jgi:hypothetical protein
MKSNSWSAAVLLIVAAFATFLSSVSIAQAQSYVFHDLGKRSTLPPGYLAAKAYGINRFGGVAGELLDLSSPVAARLQAGGSPTVFPALGTRHASSANSINDHGELVGWMRFSPSVIHAFYVDGDDVRYDLHPSTATEPGDCSELKKINNYGEVIGRVFQGAGPSEVHRFAYFGDISGWHVNLATAVDVNFMPTDLNTSNADIVGNGTWGGVIYNPYTNTTRYLGWLTGDWTNRAAAINDAGEVAGTISGLTGFLYDGTTTATFGAGRILAVTDINRHGSVVGNMSGPGSETRPYIYLKRSRTLTDLNSYLPLKVGSIWTLLTATGINDDGSICGMARRLARPEDGVPGATYVYHPYLLAWTWSFPWP